MEEESEDYEIINDRKTMQLYCNLLTDKGFHATYISGFRRRNREIARITKAQSADLLIMGSHGHKGLKDFIFGETVNQVRHLVDIPVFIAQ
jgi:manganese transport protein